ncbi:MAG: carbon-nitrogen hydrolase family protein [Candidatus Dadabacteria bacterium]|nr:MAG: carbon-nitrogen hydrolase family protein [Candidatus Dadabacteria bacterium]
MANQTQTIKIAAIQACPVYMDLEASVDKACTLIAEVGLAGAKLAVFPEAFIPGYPAWVWFVPPGQTHPLREIYSELQRNSLSLPDSATEKLCLTAKKAGVTVAIGINEKNSETSSTTLYNTLLYIGSDGNVLGKHRKLIPTAGERLVWGQGDGSDLAVYDTPCGKIGGLICWENYMPLARYAMYAWGTQIYVAPTWDRGEPWTSSMRHIAKEGRCFVVGCCQAVHINDIPDRLAVKEKYLSGVEGWLNPGGSLIVDPDGKIVAGPANEEETILYAEIEPDQLIGPKWQLDSVGHYARPDIFKLTVNLTPKPLIEEARETSPQLELP